MAPWKVGLFLGLAITFALSVPTRAQEAAPGSDAASYVKFGAAKGGNGDLDGAIAAFNEAIKLDPKYAPAYEFRGKAHALQNKVDEAIADYDQAVQYDPKSTNAYYRRGTLKGQKGDFDGAIVDFSHVIDLDPKYALAYYNRGHAKYFKGDLDGAMADLKQAINLDATSAYPYFIRGLIQHAKGVRIEAASDFQKSAGLNFPYAAFWNWIALMENGQRGMASQQLAASLTKPEMFKPDDWATNIGNFLLGKITQDQLLEKTSTGEISETTGRLCEAWYYIGVTKRLAGDNKGALDCFNKSIATQSTSTEEFVEATREAAALQKP